MALGPFCTVDADTGARIVRDRVRNLATAFARGDRYSNKHSDRDWRVLDVNGTPVPRSALTCQHARTRQYQAYGDIYCLDCGIHERSEAFPYSTRADGPLSLDEKVAAVMVDYDAAMAMVETLRERRFYSTADDVERMVGWGDITDAILWAESCLRES